MDPYASAEIVCPYCGERLEIGIDVSAGSQQYVEDCQVCCRPIVLIVGFDEDGKPSVEVHAEDE